MYLVYAVFINVFYIENKCHYLTTAVTSSVLSALILLQKKQNQQSNCLLLKISEALYHLYPLYLILEKRFLDLDFFKIYLHRKKTLGPVYYSILFVCFLLYFYFFYFFHHFFIQILFHSTHFLAIFIFYSTLSISLSFKFRFYYIYNLQYPITLSMHRQSYVTQQILTYQQLVQFIFKNSGISIAYFYNSWCTPCKLIEQYISSYQKQFQISFARIDSDKSQQLSTRFDIHAIPTFILLRKLNGEINLVEEVVSAHPQKLKRLLQSAFNLKNNKI